MLGIFIPLKALEASGVAYLEDGIPVISSLQTAEELVIDQILLV